MRRAALPGNRPASLVSNAAARFPPAAGEYEAVGEAGMDGDERRGGRRFPGDGKRHRQQGAQDLPRRADNSPACPQARQDRHEQPGWGGNKIGDRPRVRRKQQRAAGSGSPAEPRAQA